METMGTKIMVLFLGIYLGIVFLPLLSGSACPPAALPGGGQRPRYRILARLGAEEKMRSRLSMFRFCLPSSCRCCGSRSTRWWA